MKVTVKLFATLRERYGASVTEFECADSTRVLDLWTQLFNDSPPENLLCALNHRYAALDSFVQEGDEVGFFPPVNGG